MKSKKIDEVQKRNIVLILMILGLIVFFFYVKYKPKSLINHFVVTQGIVTKVGYANKMGGYIEYIFFLNGKQYKTSQILTEFKNVDEESVLVQKGFPVIVDTTSGSYTTNKMLFDSLSFVRYGLPYPDSVKWLVQYLK